MEEDGAGVRGEVGDDGREGRGEAGGEGEEEVEGGGKDGENRGVRVDGVVVADVGAELGEGAVHPGEEKDG